MLVLIANSGTALGFLAAFIELTTFLTERGYALQADALVLIYLVLSIPIFLAQVAMVVDLMLTLVGGPSVNVPALRAVADRAPAGRLTRIFAGVLTTVSLFSSVSTWALSIVVPPVSALELARMKYRTEAGVFAAALARIKNRA